MDAVEKDLFLEVGHLLHEISWSNDYQINPNVALDSFFKAFREHGFKINLNDKFGIASFVLDYEGKSFGTSMTYEKILTGWNHQPKSSPSSLYDSICQVYNNLENFVFDLKNPTPKMIDKRNEWHYYRNSETRKVRQKMEDNWLPFFMKYNENMFISVDGKIPALEEPKIFGKVMKNFPLHVYRTACKNDFFSEGARGGPVEEYLLEFNPLELVEDLDPEEYYPSKFTMKNFFWGHYLNEFSNEKGYPLRHNYSDSKLKSIMIGKESSLERGDRISWEFKSLGNWEN